MIGIYKITNINGKVYVGQSVNIINRQRYYRNPNSCKNQTKLNNSINKYGWVNHVFEIIEECDIDQLNIRERYWQEYYNAIEGGLNCRLTKTTDKSGKLSSETKKRIGFSNLGKTHSNETKIKMANSHKGIKYSLEVRKKVSINHSRHNAKLSDNDVHTICKIYLDDNIDNCKIKELYPDIHCVTLCEIRNKKVYKHITNIYNISKPSKKGIKFKNKKKVLCVEDNLIFNGIYETAEYYKLNYRQISRNALSLIKKPINNKTFKYV